MKEKNQRKGRGFRVYPVDVFSLLFIFVFVLSLLRFLMLVVLVIASFGL